MQYISSDTNVWIDFSVIGRSHYPFRLQYTYIMHKDAVTDELLSPPGLGAELVSYGLLPVEISIEEFFLAQSYGERYKRLSTYDRIALSIAKTRDIILLTGDKALRNAAAQEDVSFIGTLGILDQLKETNSITLKEYRYCIEQLLQHNGKDVRLPEAELRLRLNEKQAPKELTVSE